MGTINIPTYQQTERIITLAQGREGFSPFNYKAVPFAMPYTSFTVDATSYSTSPIVTMSGEGILMSLQVYTSTGYAGIALKIDGTMVDYFKVNSNNCYYIRDAGYYYPVSNSNAYYTVATIEGVPYNESLEVYLYNANTESYTINIVTNGLYWVRK